MKSAKKSSLDKIKEQLRCGTDKQLQLKTIAFEKLRIIESIVNDRKERIIERRYTRNDIDKEIEHEKILKQRERAEKKKRDNLAGNIDEEGEFDENNEIFQPLNEDEQEKLRLEYERKILEGDYMEESDENPEEEDEEEEIPEPVEDEDEEEDEKSVSRYSLTHLTLLTHSPNLTHSVMIVTRVITVKMNQLKKKQHLNILLIWIC